MQQAKSLEVNLEGLGSQLRRHGIQAIQEEPVSVEQLQEQDGVVGLGEFREAFGENGEGGVEEWEETLGEWSN